jgi:hypothetical protein
VKTNTIELQEIDVSAVVVTPDGDAADVVVNITYVEKQTMTVKTEVVSEKWVRTDDGWFAAKPAKLGEPADAADVFGAPASSTSPDPAL